jgi:hypothetical protein
MGDIENIETENFAGIYEGQNVGSLIAVQQK